MERGRGKEVIMIVLVLSGDKDALKFLSFKLIFAVRLSKDKGLRVVSLNLDFNVAVKHQL